MGKDRAEVEDYRQQRPHVQSHIEWEPKSILIQAQEILPEKQMPGTRNRQELREPLNYPQKYRLEKFQHYLSP